MLKAQHKSCSLGTTSSPQPGETTHTLSFERWCLMEWNSPNEQTSQRLDPKLVEPHSPVPFQNSEFEDWQTPQQQIFKRHNDTICTTIRWVVMTCHCCTPILSHCLSLRLLSVDSGCKPSRACWSQPALCWHSQHWSSPNNHPGISCRCCDITTCRKLYRKSCGKSKLKRSKKPSPPSLSRLKPVVLQGQCHHLVIQVKESILKSTIHTQSPSLSNCYLVEILLECTCQRIWIQYEIVISENFNEETRVNVYSIQFLYLDNIRLSLVTIATSTLFLIHGSHRFHTPISHLCLWHTTWRTNCPLAFEAFHPNSGYAMHPMHSMYIWYMYLLGIL